jgi:predicted dehydrogenase
MATTTNDKLRFGIIGIGGWALLHHVPNLSKAGKVEIVAICRRDPQALAEAQAYLGVPEAYTDWRAMLGESDLDAVLVTTPHHLHCEQSLAALERGLHVLVQKPMALTSKEAWTMVDAADRAGRVLTVAYNRRGDPRWRAAKRALAEGAIGQVRQVNVAMSCLRRWLWETEGAHAQVPKTFTTMVRGLFENTGIPDSLGVDWGEEGHWRRDPAQHGGGAFINMGIHWVDAALWLAGAPPADVVAFQETTGLPVECYINVQARLANGVLLSLTSADMPVDSDRWAIYGDEGMLAADGADLWIQRSEEREAMAPEGPGISPDEAFVATVTEGAPNMATGREGAYDVALIEAAYRSAREGRIVHVELPEGAGDEVAA